MTVSMLEHNTEESIEKKVIPAEEWDNLTLDQLFEQKNILFARWVFLVEQKYKYAPELKAALDKIEAVIATR